LAFFVNGSRQKIDRNHGDAGYCGDVSVLGSGEPVAVALYLGYAGEILQVQLLGGLSRLLLVFFVRAYGIDRNRGDVSILGRVLTSASKGNWHMVPSLGNTQLAPL